MESEFEARLAAAGMERAPELSPRREALQLIDDCKDGSGRLDEQRLVELIADVIVQRNTVAGYTVVFRDVVTGERSY